MNYKTVGMIFNFASYIPLLFPIYSTKVDGEFGYDLIVRGFNFVEFSPWGSLLITMPLILVAIAYLKVKHSTQNLLLIPFYMLNTITVYNANAAADKWVRSATDNFVLCKPYTLFYLLFIFIALLCLYIHNHKYYDYN